MGRAENLRRSTRIHSLANNLEIDLHFLVGSIHLSHSTNHGYGIIERETKESRRR